MRRVVSREAETRASSDGSQHTPHTLCSCPRSVLRQSWPPAKSQSLTLMSAEHEARAAPAASKAASLTVDVCPLSVRSSAPDSLSQTLSVPSSDAVTSSEYTCGAPPTLI